jgi:hypothetical protein
MAAAVEFIPTGVDTPDDLRRIRALLETTSESGSSRL